MERKLLTNGTTSKNKNGRWNGSVWYMDEHGERKRKSFSADTQKEVKERIKSYIEHFYDKPEIVADNASTKQLQESMQNWLEVFKYPSLQRTTYDRYEVTAKYQIYPYIGKKVVRDITGADIKKVLNSILLSGKSYSTCKKAYVEREIFDYIRSMRTGFTVQSLAEYAKLRKAMAVWDKYERSYADTAIEAVAAEIDETTDDTKEILLGGLLNENRVDLYQHYAEDDEAETTEEAHPDTTSDTYTLYMKGELYALCGMPMTSSNTPSE